MYRFSDMVREARLERGLSQAALAEKAGLSQSEVNRIELGQLSANLDSALKLQLVLGLPPHARGLAMIEAAACHHHTTPDVIFAALREALDSGEDAVVNGEVMFSIHDTPPEGSQCVHCATDAA